MTYFFSPGDIIIERWLPYATQAKRQTIVQRAAAAKDYPAPRNLVIVYDAVPVRVVRQFQRFGVTQENPQAYLARYGASLLDATSLVQQARAAGVVEDIVCIPSVLLENKKKTRGKIISSSHLLPALLLNSVLRRVASRLVSHIPVHQPKERQVSMVFKFAARTKVNSHLNPIRRPVSQRKVVSIVVQEESISLPLVLLLLIAIKMAD